MKRFTLLTLFISLFFSSCLLLEAGIKGSGNVITQKREISSFKAIEACCGLSVYIVQGDKESVEVITDDNLQEMVKTYVSGDKLILKVKGRIRKATELKVNVVLRDVHSISISSGVACKSELLKLKDVKVSSSSGSSGKLELSANSISCKTSSGSSLKLMGETSFFDISTSSGSSFNGYKLKAESCNSKSSSGSVCKIFVTDNLKAKASSGGAIRYKGTPHTVDKKTSSGGSISSRN